ncbi:MAG: 4-hydroxy-tetrahydrodipicolinate reductase [Bacteroidetes bacterium]|nr:MAG: 4-hydroxy-tetrahydrodipicolinate reductase [Bacteroidota bacterium]
MKIALLGYGKMGVIIEKMALERGHEVVLRVGRDGCTDEELRRADVAIDFSLPSVAFSNIQRCIENDVPVVSGTTGWLDRKPEIEALCKERNGSFIYASNFSLGVNLFFALNEHLAKLMNGHEVYSAKLTEIHHTQKLDAPSGTAITLAEGMLKNLENYSSWKLVENGELAHENQLPIEAERIDPTPGTHIIQYSSEIDDIEIKHTAHNRNGFALGAVIASEYLLQNPGIRTMKDVLGLA